MSPPDGAEPSADPTPDDISRHSFDTAFRGYEQLAVRAYLNEVAGALREARERGDLLSAELAESRQRADELARFDEDRLTEILGEETTRILTVARESAASMRAKAEEYAAATRRRADEDAAATAAASAAAASAARDELEAQRATARGEAETAATAATAEAAAVTERAAADAEEVVAAAADEARRLVAEAEGRRAAVLADLARRRELGRGQLERLRAGRDRLLAAYQRVQDSLSEITDELRAAVVEAREAAGTAAGDALADPDLVPTAGSTTAATAGAPASASDAIADGADDPLLLGDDDAGEPSPPEGHAVGSSGAEGGDATASTPDIVLTDTAATVVAAAPGVTVAAALGGGAVDVVEVVEVVDVAALVEAPPRPPSSDVADDVVADDVVADDTAAAPLGDVLDAQDLPVEAATGEPEVVEAAAADEGSPFDGEAEEGGEGGVAPPAAVDGVLARLRSGGRSAPATPPSGDPLAPVEQEGYEPAADDATSASTAEVDAVGTEPTGDEPAPEDLDPVEAAVARRDAALTPIERQVARAWKRVLADEQNEVLDALRRRRGSIVLTELLPDPAAHAARFREAASASLLDAARAGGELVDVGAGEDVDVSVVAEVAGRSADDLAEGIRESVGLAGEDGGEDRDELAERVRGAYRDWKVERVDELARHSALAAFSAGTFAAAPATAVLSWHAAPGVVACPDCEDNALAGPTRRGEPFPTGHPVPPAHPGCRCVALVEGR